ncbi:MAG: DUF72 domain-containing protein [Promethearchaeota archaeon]
MTIVFPKILIGTSGWGYDEWVGPFYPKGLAVREYLQYYSEIFYTSEINTSFYHIPAKQVVQSWVKKTPKNFLFTAKLPKIITHTYKLRINESWAPLMSYMDSMKPLLTSKKLLAFLIQLPPSFQKSKDFRNLKEFITNWPEDWEQRGYYLVVEFRDKSWMDDSVFEYLRNQNLTYCSVIEPKLPPWMEITNRQFCYIRFHGYGENIWFNYEFSANEIKEWASKIRKILNDIDCIGIYFNNHFSGYATKNALMMMRELNVVPRKDPNDVRLFDIKKQSGTIARGQMNMDKFLK